MLITAATVSTGSPPRMRGKQTFFYCDFLFHGITPAHAGKTASGLHKAKGGQDHPRACGENQKSTNALNLLRGSPPRMRGKRVSSAQYLSTAGITPAHAGKTRCGFYTQKLNKDHPRTCGENLAQPPPASRGAGSPPRMRGKPVIYTAAQAPPRITPAHAGKTLSVRRWKCAPTDHPRACGENHRGVVCRDAFQGSPPRMRGKQRTGASRFFQRGITPAHAGKT